ncbi:MAG: transposase [Proteobacteria bacterium]|nr:transposase [Pseudomonadota bacterium]
MKREKYNQEFKDEAVKLVTEQVFRISEAARNLGIHPSLLGRWKRQIEGGDVEGGVQNGLLRSVGNSGDQISHAASSPW